VAAFAQLAVVGRGSNTCVYVIAIFTLCESTEQHICIKFYFKIGKTATETYQLLQQAYGEDAMGRTQVFDWFRRFKEGRNSDESDPRSGRPSTSRNEEMITKVKIIFRNNRRLTVREIADDCGISVGSCDAISTDDLHTKRVCAKFVPRLLTDDQQSQNVHNSKGCYLKTTAMFLSSKMIFEQLLVFLFVTQVLQSCYLIVSFYRHLNF